MGKIDSQSIHAADSARSWVRLERAAGWYFSPFLRRLVPTPARDALRGAREWILGRYLTRHLPHDQVFEQSTEDALASQSLSIIVPVHDAPEVTRRCLLSLQKYAPKSEIILVDDASRLDETMKLLDDFSGKGGWILIRNQEPLGHSRACGIGTDKATRPYLCLLNSDTVVTPWCWRLITQAFNGHPDIGIAGPSTSHAGTAQTSPLANFTRHYLNDSQICAYAKRLLANSRESILEDIPWVSGFALFIRRSLWEEVGGFDRNLPDYGNDVELCKCILARGYRVVWVRNSYIHHLASASYGKTIGAKSILARVGVAEDYLKQKYRNGHL